MRLPIQGSARRSCERSSQLCPAHAGESGIRQSRRVPDTAVEAVLSERPFAGSRGRLTGTTACLAPDLSSSFSLREGGPSSCASPQEGSVDALSVGCYPGQLSP